MAGASRQSAAQGPGKGRIVTDGAAPPRPITVRQAAAAAALTVMLLVIWAASAAGLVTGNPTTSVPRGLYHAAAPGRATHVSFCLAHRHRHAAYYRHFCSPGNPGGLRILKRIAQRLPDGGLIVAGDGPNPLDSRIVGPVRPDQIRAWWRPLVQIRTFR